MTKFTGIFAWDGKCGYFSVDRHRCENPTCVSITSNTSFLCRCLKGNVCKSVQIYKSFHSTSKLPDHSNCLFRCNRQIKPTRARDITIQFVRATERSPFPASVWKRRQKWVQMLMASHVFGTGSNQNCLWNLLVSRTDTRRTPHLGPCDYKERMCISKSFQQPCALSGDEGWECIMKIERNKKSSLTWFWITCGKKKSEVQSQRHRSKTWLKDYRCIKHKFCSFFYLVTFLVLTESKSLISRDSQWIQLRLVELARILIFHENMNKLELLWGKHRGK